MWKPRAKALPDKTTTIKGLRDAIYYIGFLRTGAKMHHTKHTSISYHKLQEIYESLENAKKLLEAQND